MRGMGRKEGWRAVLTRPILQNIQEGISVIFLCPTALPCHPVRDICSLFLQAGHPIHRYFCFDFFFSFFFKKSIRWAYAAFCKVIDVCVGSGACLYNPSIHPWQIPTWSWRSQKRHRYTPGPLCSRTRTAPEEGGMGDTSMSAGKLNKWHRDQSLNHLKSMTQVWHLCFKHGSPYPLL